MIPQDYITEWRDQAPWVDDAQVEQDLVISRALIEIFSHETLRHAGGTALFKVQLPAASLDIADVRLSSKQTQTDKSAPRF